MAMATARMVNQPKARGLKVQGNSLVTVVCTANICRSPMGHAILQAKAASAGLNIDVNSCGVQAMVGKRPDEKALLALTQAGYTLDDNKRAEQLLMPQAHAASLILVMEQRHKQWISQNLPAYAGKVWLMGQWAGALDVADPIGRAQTDFDACLKLLEQYAEQWIPKIKALI